MTAPQLTGDALTAVRHRGGHLQIIACAGAGKTEVVSQRVVDLLADNVPPRGIVAFTFTEKAATELKERITHRVAERLGPGSLDLLSGLFVGTIHAYCFQFLQRYVPRYESYDVLDDNQLTAFLAREANRLNVKQLGNGTFSSIATFLKSVDVVENELLDPDTMPDPFRTVLTDYLATLDRYHLLTYGQQISRAVEALADPAVRDQVHADLRHLIVDEYQDVNPAQERLVELLVGPQTSLCVVGDDDQAIYQWRGSDVRNIVDFARRYPGVTTFSLTTNRRSRPTIVTRADRFAQTIPDRLPKHMRTHREAGTHQEIVAWDSATEGDEVGWIIRLIRDLRSSGTPFGDIAILVRTSAAYPRLVAELAAADIPVQPGGRTGLFKQAEASALGKTIVWLSDVGWKDGPGWGVTLSDDDVIGALSDAFQLRGDQRTRVQHFVQEWKAAVPRDDRVADLIGELYSLFDVLDVARWDVADPSTVNRLGTLARFSALLADYESVRRRARPDANAPGEQVGGQDRGKWYYWNLATHITNYAVGSYEDFDGEPDMTFDAVELTTVHRAKGLEWPAVFIASLTKNRFPTTKSGKPQNWLVPRQLFNAARYEGGDPDERRLFYVAMTRARDWLSLSRHNAVTKNRVAPSPYWTEHQDLQLDPAEVQVPTSDATNAIADDPITVTYSEMAAFLACGQAYRLRNLIGFQPRLAPELGYGKAVHHVLRTIADAARATGTVPSKPELATILDDSFFLPTANKAAHRQLKEAATRLVTAYTTTHADDLFRIWETERPFELHLDGVTVAGRADVILDKEGGVETGLAILDYKTSTTDVSEHELQLQVYVDAGRREGLDVRGAYIHDLKAGQRAAVPIDASAISAAEGVVADAAARLKARDFTARPGAACRTCEVRTVCSAAKR